MDIHCHKCCSDSCNAAKRGQTNHGNRPLIEDEMPQQGKNVVQVNIRRTVAHTDLQALKLPPEWKQQPIPIQEQVPNINHRCVQTYHQGEFQPQQPQHQQEQNYTQQSQTYLKYNQQHLPKPKDPSPPPMPYQNVTQHQVGKQSKDQFIQQPPQKNRETAYSYQNPAKKPSYGNPQNLQQQPHDDQTRKNTPQLMQQCQQADFQNLPKKVQFVDPPQKPPQDHFKQQPPQEYRKECSCTLPKQLSRSSHSQEPLFSNDPQGQAQRNLAPFGRSSSMAKVVPVPRPECNSRQVPQDSRQPSFMADEAKQKFSPEGCEEDNHKMAANDKLPKYENQLFANESTSTIASVVSAKNGDELRSMVREEMELQLVLMELSSIIKKEDLLHSKPSTRDKSAPNQSKSLESKEKTSTSACAGLEKEPQVDCSNNVDDIVNCTVITPMIRKIQKMYIKNLRDEIDLVEYLERVPALVSEVCKKAGSKDQSKLNK